MSWEVDYIAHHMTWKERKKDGGCCVGVRDAAKYLHMMTGLWLWLWTVGKDGERDTLFDTRKRHIPGTDAK